MMCKKPFTRCTTLTKKEALLTDKRLAATPFGCGQCLPCRINKAREWTHRMLLEQTVHEESSFVTLTYDNDHLPDPPDVSKSHVQLFLKKLRRRLYGKRIRYFAVGEYGEKSWRPHYHLALFGVGERHDSEIGECWHRCDKDNGIMVGDLNRVSARYISGYCVKKLNRAGLRELGGRLPEFLLSSRQGGLGIDAVWCIADQILQKKYYNHSKQGVIRELKYGKSRRYPLGRYLTQNLSEILETDEYIKACEMYDYQEGLIDEHADSDCAYYSSLVDGSSQKRVIQAERQKIYKSKRRL